MTQEEKEEYNIDIYNEDFRAQQMEERRPPYREDYGVRDRDFL